MEIVFVKRKHWWAWLDVSTIIEENIPQTDISCDLFHKAKSVLSVQRQTLRNSVHNKERNGSKHHTELTVTWERFKGRKQKLGKFVFQSNLQWRIAPPWSFHLHFYQLSWSFRLFLKIESAIVKVRFNSKFIWFSFMFGSYIMISITTLKLSITINISNVQWYLQIAHDKFQLLCRHTAALVL